MTRDSRTVERKKYGKAKARKSFQFSKKISFMSSLPVSIGIAGIGNVGSEVVSQLIKHKEYKKSFTIKAVSYRNKKRNVIYTRYYYYSDAKKLDSG